MHKIHASNSSFWHLHQNIDVRIFLQFSFSSFCNSFNNDEILFLQILVHFNLITKARKFSFWINIYIYIGRYAWNELDFHFLVYISSVYQNATFEMSASIYLIYVWATRYCPPILLNDYSMFKTSFQLSTFCLMCWSDVEHVIIFGSFKCHRKN